MADTFEYLWQNAGGTFDGECVRAFLAAEDDIVRIRSTFPDSRGRTSGRPLSLVAPADAEVRFAV